VGPIAFNPSALEEGDTQVLRFCRPIRIFKVAQASGLSHMRDACATLRQWKQRGHSTLLTIQNWFSMADNEVNERGAVSPRRLEHVLSAVSFQLLAFSRRRMLVGFGRAIRQGLKNNTEAASEKYF